MMKLIYISPLRYPSDRAGSLFSMKSCEAFANENIDVELWIPIRRASQPNIDLFEYFGVKKKFKIRYFFALDLTGFSDKAYHLLYYSFAFSVFFYSLGLRLFRKINDYVFYSHEQFAIFLLTLLSKRTFYEIHDFPGQYKIYDRLFKRIGGVVTTNKWKGEELSKRFNFPKSSILVVPNAVDIENFSIDLSQKDARKKLDLSNENYLFGYVGTLKTMGMEKGVSTAILSLKFLSENFKLYIVGGDSVDDLKYYQTLALENNLSDRIIFVGQIPHKDIPLYMNACDSLIAPFPKNDHYSYYMSPMKIFEYMASRKPIIVTDLPSLREILKDGETALFVPPSDPEALAKSIIMLSENNIMSQKLSENAYQEVAKKYTWRKRSQNIAIFLKNKIKLSVG